MCACSRSPQLLALLGGLAGGWRWADSGQQKGWEGAGGSDSVGGPGIAGEGAKVGPDAHAGGGWDEWPTEALGMEQDNSKTHLLQPDQLMKKSPR